MKSLYLIIKKYLFDIVWLILAFSAFILTYTLTSNSLVLIVTGMSAIMNTYFIYKKHWVSAIFGMINSIAEGILANHVGLTSKVISNFGFWLPINALQLVMWYLNKKGISKNLTWSQSITAILLGGMATYTLISYNLTTQNKAPYIDAFTTIIGITASILLLNYNRLTFLLWAIIDVIEIFMWGFMLHNYAMMMIQFIYLTICIAGLWKWRRNG